MTTFTIEAYNVGGDPTRPQHVTIRAIVDTVDEAREIAAQFPKSCKLTGCRYGQANGTDRGIVTGSITLKSNGINGGINETGVRRFRSWLKAAAQVGTVEWGTMCAATNTVNGYRSLAEFEAAIA